VAGILQNIHCEPILVNGVEDHVHILCNFSRTITVANLIEQTKTNSSKWMKDRGAAYRYFFWQGGYGAFSVSESNVARVRDYIERQEVHHRKSMFQERISSIVPKARCPDR
jgi:REP element-mobilizing transposase RayT